MTWSETISKAGRNAGKYLIDNSHAQQAIPSQHRSLAAGGMFVGWWALDKMRDIIFGMNQVSEGEYEEIKREDVPLPLRFLHKTVDWNPHSDDPKEQWKKLAHQMLPALGAGFGTMGGSMFAFELNNRAQDFDAFKKSSLLAKFMDAENAAQYAQSKPLRMMTAFTGGFSAASMMPLIYGAFLNMSFATANGARIFTGNVARGAAGPAKALNSQIGKVSAYIKDAVNKDGKINEEWAQGFVERVLKPLFGKDLSTPEAQAQVRGKIQAILEKAFKAHERDLNSGKIQKDAFVEAVAKDIKDVFGKDFVPTLKKVGLDVNKATLGNANPLIRSFNEFLVNIGIRSKEASSASFASRIKEQNIAKAASQGASSVMGGAPA